MTVDQVTKWFANRRKKPEGWRPPEKDAVLERAFEKQQSGHSLDTKQHLADQLGMTVVGMDMRLVEPCHSMLSVGETLHGAAIERAMLSVAKQVNGVTCLDGVTCYMAAQAAVSCFLGISKHQQGHFNSALVRLGGASGLVIALLGCGRLEVAILKTESDWWMSEIGLTLPGGCLTGTLNPELWGLGEDRVVKQKSEIQERDFLELIEKSVARGMTYERAVGGAPPTPYPWPSSGRFRTGIVARRQCRKSQRTTM